MSLQIGQVLDKYELLERVGQGGMAVVYRGLDRSLKRVVAVKILHKHLADYQEARDRFEREAQAVAKLRHENILEIFDYSGAAEAEAAGSMYIVTEFIEGGTLRQAMTDRPIAFPEIGAMLVLQVCRALAHAHSAKVLHRDVKPENIMIRADGVVKLMDFGISHMVDLERLTVTGQLLGSPAYMAPEHVQGRPLDYRTDVFAAGIVLYQLTTAKLPFEGKNPHEVLKRIAECKFVDPRQLNPRIGNRLGRIILRAMAAEPKDRFPTISEMVGALESYLEESGVAADKVQAELGRYFGSPAAYELALRERLIDHLTRAGQQLLTSDNRAGALDVFDRVLTIDPDNAKVIGILDGINRRVRVKTTAAVVILAGMLGAGVWGIHRRMQVAPTEPATSFGGAPIAIGAPRVSAAAPDHGELPGPADAGVILADAAVAIGDPPGPDRPPPSAPDAAVAAVAQTTRFRVSPAADSEYQLGGGGEWRAVPADGLVAVELGALTEVAVRNTSGCCQGFSQPGVKPGADLGLVVLPYLPGAVIPQCAEPGVRVEVNGRPWNLDERFDVVFGNSLDSNRSVKIVFTGADTVDATPITVKVEPGITKDVACVVR